MWGVEGVSASAAPLSHKGRGGTLLPSPLWGRGWGWGLEGVSASAAPRSHEGRGERGGAVFQPPPNPRFIFKPSIEA